MTEPNGFNDSQRDLTAQIVGKLRDAIKECEYDNTSFFPCLVLALLVVIETTFETMGIDKRTIKDIFQEMINAYEEGGITGMTDVETQES
jgi:hypothetical protein